MKLLPVLVVAVLALTACGVSRASICQAEFGNAGGGEFVVRATVVALICAQVQSRF
jgi:hypothetical protein